MVAGIRWTEGDPVVWTTPTYPLVHRAQGRPGWTLCGQAMGADAYRPYPEEGREGAWWPPCATCAIVWRNRRSALGETVGDDPDLGPPCTWCGRATASAPLHRPNVAVFTRTHGVASYPFCAAHIAWIERLLHEPALRVRLEEIGRGRPDPPEEMPVTEGGVGEVPRKERKKSDG